MIVTLDGGHYREIMDTLYGHVSTINWRQNALIPDTSKYSRTEAIIAQKKT